MTAKKKGTEFSVTFWGGSRLREALALSIVLRSFDVHATVSIPIVAETMEGKNLVEKGPSPKTLLFPGKAVIISREYASIKESK